MAIGAAHGETMRIKGSAAEDGHVTAERIGLTLLVAVLVAAILALPIGSTFVGLVRAALCRIVGLTCVEGGLAVGEPTGPCVVAARQEVYELGVGIAIVDLGEGNALLVESLSDGSQRITTIRDAVVGVSAGVGFELELDLGTAVVGASASASIAAALGGTITQVETFATPEDARDAIDHATVQNRLEALPAPLDALATRVQDGLDRSDPEPVETEEVIGLELIARATAGASAGTGLAVADIGAAIAAAEQATVSSDGTITIGTTMSAEIAGAVGLGSALAGAAGGDAGIQVRLRSDGTPLDVTVTLSAGTQTAGSLDAIGSFDDPASLVDPTSGGLTVIEARIDLLSRPDLGDEALALLTPNPVSTVSSLPVLWEAIGTADSTIARVTYAVDSVDHGLAISGEVVAEVGVHAGRSTSSLSITGAEYWDPISGGFVPWEACHGI